MKIITISLATLALLAPMGAMAQSAGSKATSGSVSQAAAQSAAISNGGAGGNVLIAAPPGRTQSEVEYKGTYGIKNVPGVIPPALAAGVNACAVSASVGGGWMGAGLSGGAAWSDKSCERRAEAAMLAGLGLGDLALRHLARDPEVFQTLVDAGLITTTAAAAAPPEGVSPRQGQLVSGGYSAPVAGAEGVCRVKPGTTRTVITDWPDRMACAAKLGLR